MFHKVEKVEPLENYILKVYFQNGIIKYYDVKPLFKKWEIFNSLHQINGLFNQVKVDQGGFGIIWNDEIDLSSEELWENGLD